MTVTSFQWQSLLATIAALEGRVGILESRLGVVGKGTGDQSKDFPGVQGVKFGEFDVGEVKVVPGKGTGDQSHDFHAGGDVALREAAEEMVKGGSRVVEVEKKKENLPLSSDKGLCEIQVGGAVSVDTGKGEEFAGTVIGSGMVVSGSVVSAGSVSTEPENGRSHTSWAEEVSDEEGSSSSGSVQMPVKAGEKVRRAVSFGALDVGDEKSESGGFGQYVRAGHVKAVKDWLLDNAHVKIPSRQMRKLALALYASGAMPSFFQDGKKELRAMALVGDMALSLCFSQMAFANGLSVEEAQGVRSSQLSDVNLRKCMVSSGLSNYLVVPSGVDVKVAKTTATAAEAIAGAIWLVYQRLEPVIEFARALGLVL